MSALLALLAILAGLILPGYCLTRRLFDAPDLLETSVYSVGLGLATVPAVVFVAAWAMSGPFTLSMVFGAALAIVVTCAPWRPTEAGRATRSQLVAVLGLVATALLLLQLTEVRAGTSLRMFGPCLQVTALHLAQHDGAGWSLFDPALGHHVTHVLSHVSAPVLGLENLLEVQRPLNGAVVAVTLLLAGRAGLELTTLLVFFALAGGATLVARTHLASLPRGLAVGIVTLVGMHGLVAYMINETTFALMGGLLLLASLVREGRRAGELVAAGLVLGFATGSRLAALAWIVPVLILAKGTPRRAWLPGLVAFALSVLPWLLVPWIAKGTPFFHPISPTSLVEHDLLGFTFRFRPLNWPFVDELVRAPGHALPSLLLLPVFALRSAGSALVAATLLGFVATFLRPRSVSHGLAALGWAAPILCFLHVLTYTDYEKASWMLLAAPVVPLLLARFVAFVQSRRWTWLLPSWAALTVVLSLVPGWLAWVELPRDTRPYEIATPDEERTPTTLTEQRGALDSVTVLPCLQRVEHESALWRSLVEAGGGQSFRSGAIGVVLDEFARNDVRFPVHTTLEKTQTVDFLAVEPFDHLEGTLAGSCTGRFEVQLRLPASGTVGVRLSGERRHLTIEVDPGPEPRELRYVAFVVFAEWERFPLESVRVKVGDEDLPVRLLGHTIVTADPSGETESSEDTALRIVTNLPTPPAPPPYQEVRFGPLVYGFTGIECFSDGRGSRSRDSVAWCRPERAITAP